MPVPTVVLVASADEGVRAQVRLTLGGDRFRMHEADGTEAAIRVIAAELPQLLVLDHELPGAGALAVARTVRGQPETADARVLVLARRGGDPPDEQAVDAVLGLPTTAFAMLRKVDDLLGAG